MSRTGRPARDDVSVEPMRGRHLRGVMAIEEAVYPRPWSVRLFASERSRTRDRRYVVAVGGCRSWWRPRPVLGYAGVIVRAGEAHVTTVAVDPTEHRRKIGTRLVAAILRAAVDLGATGATLEVRTTNVGARRLYEQFGFSGAGVHLRYYRETGEDALVMVARGIQEPAYLALLAAQEARATEPGGASGNPDLAVPWIEHRVGLGDLDEGVR